MNQPNLTPLTLKLRDRKLPQAFVERLTQDQPKVDAGELLMYLVLLEHHLIQHYEDILYGGRIRGEDELQVELSLRDADCDQFLRGLGRDPDKSRIQWWLFRSTLQCIASDDGLTGDIHPCVPCRTRAEAIEAVLSRLRLLEDYLDRFYVSETPSRAAKHLLDIYTTVLQLNSMCVELSYWRA